MADRARRWWSGLVLPFWGGGLLWKYLVPKTFLDFLDVAFLLDVPHMNLSLASVVTWAMFLLGAGAIAWANWNSFEPVLGGWKKWASGLMVILITGAIASVVTPSSTSSVRASPTPTPSQPNPPISPAAPLSSAPCSAGNNNTILGDAPCHLGDGNTFVGAADAHGNVSHNRGAVAIGSGAHAGSGDVAIGAGARAGNGPSVVNITGNGNIIAPGMTGGNINLKNEAPPPTFTVIAGLEATPNSDGSYIWRATFKVNAASPPNNIGVSASGPGVSDLNVNGIDATAQINVRTGTNGSGVYYYIFGQPVGRYLVEVRTQQNKQPVVGIGFNVPTP